jgi:hypothetical protein
VATPVEVLGEFDGANLSRETADELSIARIKHALLKNEAQLYNTKWYDYRRLHPTVATYYFVHCYGGAYRDAIRKAFDARGADYRKGATGDFLDKGERNTFWKLRQIADGFGMPYRPFLRAAIDYYLDQTGWTHVPRPCHLLAPAPLDAAHAAWQEDCKNRLQLPADPFFTVEGFIDHPYQVECEAWLIENALSRHNPKFALHALYKNYARVRACALPPQWLGEVEAMAA